MKLLASKALCKSRPCKSCDANPTSLHCRMGIDAQLGPHLYSAIFWTLSQRALGTCCCPNASNSTRSRRCSWIHVIDSGLAWRDFHSTCCTSDMTSLNEEVVEVVVEEVLDELGDEVEESQGS